MSVTIQILLAVAAAGVAALVVACVVRPRLQLVSAADERHAVRAADGVVLSVWRYLPPEGAAASAVVLCHGLGSNRFNLAPPGRLDLASYLAARGHDVFVLELRGAGSAPDQRGAAQWEDDFDTHLNEDLPALLDAVRVLNDQAPLVWVGHSMGGLLGLALAGGELGGRFAGVVAIGAPLTWSAHSRLLRWVARAAEALALRRLPFRVLARSLAPFAGWVRIPGWGWPADPWSVFRRTRGAVLRRALFNCVGDVSWGLVRQFGGWFREDRFTSRDGTVDYRARLQSAAVPLLLICGDRDGLAPPASLEVACQGPAGIDRTFVRLVGYGHGDLVMAHDAPERVFGSIADWVGALDPSS